MDKIDIAMYLDMSEVNDISSTFDDIKFSDGVSNNESIELVQMVDVPIMMHNDEQSLNDMNGQNLIDCFEEVILSQDDYEQNATEADQMVDSQFREPEPIIQNGEMVVIEQPKPDQRARYKSDGLRFIPGSKKHPVAIQFRNVLLSQEMPDGSLGIVMTMVTTTNNPKQTTFVHVNTLKYFTDDAVDLHNGSIFVPLTAPDIKNGEKTFPRLSIVCKKFDEYSFELTPFGKLSDESTTEKYIIPNEDQLTKAAKGKQFTSDYDLLSYKIIFQLATKQDNTVTLSNIQCETNIINEQKAPAKGILRKKSSGDILRKNRKGKIKKSARNRLRKSKSFALAIAQ